MAKCETCGAPVNLAPDGDPRYEEPSCDCDRLLEENRKLRKHLWSIAKMLHGTSIEEAIRIAQAGLGE